VPLQSYRKTFIGYIDDIQSPLYIHTHALVTFIAKPNEINISTEELKQLVSKLHAVWLRSSPEKYSSCNLELHYIIIAMATASITTNNLRVITPVYIE
jgi:hypothetical protein